jgi:hypothetical protein
MQTGLNKINVQTHYDYKQIYKTSKNQNSLKNEVLVKSEQGF